MVSLRATKKVLVSLPPPAEGEIRKPDTGLGDWFASRVVIDRRPLLLLLSSASLLPIVEPARDVYGLPKRLPSIVEARLHRLGVHTSLVRAEIGAMDRVLVAPTNDRSVLGVLTDFCLTLPSYLRGNWGDVELLDAERRLSGTPCFASRPMDQTVFPDRRAVELLFRRWSPGVGASVVQR